MKGPIKNDSAHAPNNYSQDLLRGNWYQPHTGEIMLPELFSRCAAMLCTYFLFHLKALPRQQIRENKAEEEPDVELVEMDG